MKRYRKDVQSADSKNKSCEKPQDSGTDFRSEHSISVERKVGKVIVRSSSSTAYRTKERLNEEITSTRDATLTEHENKETTQGFSKTEPSKLCINFAGFGAGTSSLSLNPADTNTQKVDYILKHFRKQLIEILQSQSQNEINLGDSETEFNPISVTNTQKIEESAEDGEALVQLDSFDVNEENFDNDWTGLVVRPRSPLSASTCPDKPNQDQYEYQTEWPCRLSQDDCLKSKLSKLDIFGQNPDGDTLLHLALIHYKNELSSTLIELMQAESLDIQNKLGQTSLHLAIHLENLEMTKKLMKHGASVEIVDHEGNTPLHLACISKREDLVKAVLFRHSITGEGNGVKKAAKTRNFNGEVPLHIALAVAMETGNDQILHLLLRRDNEINLTDGKTGKSSLYKALENKDFKIASLLIKRGADVNVAAFSGKSPLHIASELGNIEMTNALIKKNASLSAKNVEMQTPKDVAASAEVRDILEKEMKRVRRHRQKQKQLKTLEKKVLNNFGKSYK